MKSIISAVLLLSLCNTASAAVISIQPALSTASVGGAVNVAIQVADVTDLYAYQFDLSFDPAVLSLTAISEGGFLSSGGSTFFLPGTIDNASGSVTLTAGSLEGPVPGVSGSGILATLQFTGVGVGASPVALSNLLLLDSMGRDLTGIVRNGSAIVIPEPVSVMLFGSGLLACFIRRAYRGNSHRS